MLIQYAVLTGFLVLLSVEDIRTGKIRLTEIVAAALAALLLLALQGTVSWGDACIGAAAGAVWLLLSLLSRGKIGMGDGLVMAVCGLYLGKDRWVSLAVVSVAAAALAAFGLLLCKKRDRKGSFPFIPCILAADLFQAAFCLTSGRNLI